MADTCSAAKHGSPTAYWVHRCRCPETVELMKQYRAGRRILIDEVRVRRACEGERLWLNIRERKEAVRLLSRRPGMTVATMVDLLHLHERTIQRYVRKLRNDYRKQSEAA